MRIKVALVLAVAFLVAFTAPQLFAEEGKFALSAKAGTLGLGLEGVANINSNFNARLGFNTFQYDYDGTESGIDYDFDLELLTFAGLVDWFPFEKGFRLSGGLIINNNDLDMKATASGTYDIGGTTYTAAEVGTLKGNLDFDDVAPYIGLGWGSPFGRESSWSFNFDLGVIFQGSPKVTVSTDGTLAGNAAFQTNLERERQDLEDELKDFEFYPVISFGITYRF